MKKVVPAALAGILLLSFTLSSCALVNETPETLAPAEVREYQGEDLSSVNDFIENSIRGPQQVDINTYRLQVNGLVDENKTYTYNQVISQNQHYKKVVKLNCVEGWSVKILWEGVLLKDVLDRSGVSPDATWVIFRAVDGYSTAFPLEYLTDNNIILAYKINDITMPPERGFPFMVVAESKWGYKWIKWVTDIELTDKEYYGFWETRGYSNDGSLDEPFFQMSSP